MLLAFIVGAQNATASSQGSKTCEKGVDKLSNQSFGTDVPVILVHGLNGSKTDWGTFGKASFYKTIDDLPGVSVVQAFSYDASVWNLNSHWVNDKNIGQKLVKTIDCVSQLSLKNGGKGKVIVVGYSLGGLVTRYALSQRSTDGQRAIADEVGQVVLIAVPNQGTIAAPSSLKNDDINKLPHFPTKTVVHAIAGDVTRAYYDSKGHETSRETPQDDTLVAVSSAVSERSFNSANGGGVRVIQCEKAYRAWTFGWGYSESTASCEHGQMIQNAGNGVRQDTTDAITRYVTSLEKKTRVLTVHSLTLTYDLAAWPDAGYGLTGADYDMRATDMTIGTPCANCSDTPPPTINPYIDAIYYGGNCADTVEVCAIGSSFDVIGAAPFTTVGGKIPDFSAKYMEGGTYGPNLVWCFSAEKICIRYQWAAGAELSPSLALRELFNGAVWSS